MANAKDNVRRSVPKSVAKELVDEVDRLEAENARLRKPAEQLQREGVQS